MIVPIKLNKRSRISKIFPFLPKREDFRIFLNQDSSSNQEISNAINELYINGTFKTTVEKRHAFVDEKLINYIPENAIILDIGASDGSTSLDLIKLTESKLKTFYITDYNLYLNWEKQGSWTKFYDDNTGNCILAINNLFLLYPNENGFLKKKFPPKKNLTHRAPLLTPEVIKYLTSSTKIKLEHYNITKPWQGEKVNVIKVANVLNKVYFPNDVIIKSLKNVHDALLPNGILCFVENRDFNTLNKAAIFRKTNQGFKLEEQVNTTLDIQDLILNLSI